PPPIGRPIANTRFYVLDRFQQLLPPGVAGELYIGGGGVGRGYHRRADLTHEKFMQLSLPDGSSERVYRSGDLVRYLPDGQLEFLGRLDQQVKIRGFRVELGEIEATLLRHEALREAVVLTREDKFAQKYLLAYLVAAGAERPTRHALRAYLKQ